MESFLPGVNNCPLRALGLNLTFRGVYISALFRSVSSEILQQQPCPLARIGE